MFWASFLAEKTFRDNMHLLELLRIFSSILAIMYTRQNGIKNYDTIFFIALGRILKITFEKEAEILYP